MVVRALTKRRPAPCLHPRVLPTPPSPQTQPAPRKRGGKKQSCSGSGCWGRGRKGSLPGRAAPPAPPRFAPAPRGAEWRQSRARRRAELLAAWLGGRKGIIKKKALLLPCCLLRAQGRGQRRLGCLRPRRKLARSRSGVGRGREHGSERGAGHANNSGWNF